MQLSATQQAIATNASLIEQKQSALQMVAAEVQDLNALFLELGHLVAAQGAEVETVTTLADATVADVAAAREELDTYVQQKGGGCSVC